MMTASTTTLIRTSHGYPFKELRLSVALRRNRKFKKSFVCARPMPPVLEVKSILLTPSKIKVIFRCKENKDAQFIVANGVDDSLP